MFTLTEVTTPQHIKDFLQVPVHLYKNDPNWIRPLDHDIESIFDAKKNKLLRDGSAIRWVLRNTAGKFVGRIAAFVNKKTMKSDGILVGGTGFFECIDNQEAANILFTACKQWLQDKGMEAMDGPINFGERNQWWGCLYEGFEPPTYQMNYNPPYYSELFENFGFQVYFNQLVYNYELQKKVPEKFYVKNERFEKDPLFHFEHINKKQLPKYAEDLATVYNEAWTKMGHFKPVTAQQTMVTLKKMKPIMDERLIWFGYYDKKPIAFLVMLPEINQIIRHLNGQMNLWSKIKFAWHLWRGTCKDIFGVLFGVVAEHQGKGLEGALIVSAAKIVQPLKQYKTMQMNWIGDFNPKMIRLVESLDTNIIKRYHTYRLLFDLNKPFVRAPITQ